MSSISRYIDYIKGPKDTFEDYCLKAKEYNMRCIFANVYNYDKAKEILIGSDVIIAGAVAFPGGNSCLEAKLLDIQYLADAGITEIDYVLSQYHIEKNDFDYLEKEMTAIADYCRKRNVVDKAIVEMCKLNEESKVELCKIALRAKPKFLKTSTGKSYSGAKIEDVVLMKNILKDEVKI